MPGKRRNRPFEVLELDLSDLATYQASGITSELPVASNRTEEPEAIPRVGLITGNLNSRETERRSINSYRSSRSEFSN